MLTNEMANLYYRIMRNESRIYPREPRWRWIMDAEEAYNTAWQIEQSLLLSFEKRSYYATYHISNDARFLESVGGHTNSVRDLIGKYWRFVYGANVAVSTEGFSYMELAEAAGVHDLAEVELHDLPDNGNRNEASKLMTEQAYRKRYTEYSPRRDLRFDQHVSELLTALEAKDSTSGRALHTADKTTAILVTLCCDKLGLYPYRTIADSDLSLRDLAEMQTIRENDGNTDPARRYLASEMWTVDYFAARKIIQYDDSGFFTALIVMYTLMVKGQWYNWREKEYETLTAF